MGVMVEASPPEWTELLIRSAVPRSGFHVTDCLGCPRKLALLREGTELDLSRLEARLSGSILHAALAQVDPDNAEVPVSGELFGQKIVGSIDRIEEDERGIFTVDYKTAEDDKPGRPVSAPYPEQVWQQEAYRYLAKNQKGWDTVGWRIYYRRQGRWTMYEHVGPVWTEEELGEFRPHGGAFTTREIAGQCVSGLAAGDLPLVGATQGIGAGSACNFCEVEVPCKQAGYEVEL